MLISHFQFKIHKCRIILPSGKNQSACWIMGSMIATTWTDVAAAISASVLKEKATGAREIKHSHWSDMAEQVVEARRSHPSVFAQSRLGPRTMAMLLGVILLMSLSCASLAKNFTRYLQESLSQPKWFLTLEPADFRWRSYLRFALFVFGKLSHVIQSACSLLSESDTLKQKI